MHFSRRGGRADDIKALAAEATTPLSPEGPGVTSLKESAGWERPLITRSPKGDVCLSIFQDLLVRPPLVLVRARARVRVPQGPHPVIKKGSGMQGPVHYACKWVLQAKGGRTPVKEGANRGT